MLGLIFAQQAGAGPYLPPVEEFAAPVEAMVPVAGDQAEATPAEAEAAADAKASAARLTRQESRNVWKRLVRGYEPTQFGFTWDDGDERFFDFTLSLMMPVFHNIYPDKNPATRWPGQRYPDKWSWMPYPYAAATVRAGQYIGTRKSSPVVGKRFNPLFSLRWWLTDMDDYLNNGTDRWFEMVYGHESNGQWIDNLQSYQAAQQVHILDGEDPSVARDDISRGWDYVGMNFSWDRMGANDSHVRVWGKFSHYLKTSVPQGTVEEYNDWENDPEGKPRNRVDGVLLKLEWVQPFLKSQIPLADGRLAVTWRTGIARPFEFNTWEVEAGVRFGQFPFEVWYRDGYNSDFIDYYRRDESFGVRFSLDEF